MTADPLMFTIWVRNDVTGEATQFKGQGNGIAEAFKDGLENATAAFRKGSDGDAIADARFGVVLPSGDRVLRDPTLFASRQPYDPAKERKDAPSGVSKS